MDGFELNKYAPEAPGMIGASTRQANIRERIDMAVKQAEQRLVAVKRAKEIFDKNPDLEELLNIMQNAHF